MQSLLDKKLSQLQYIILPGRCLPGYAHLDLHNQVYEYWKNFWREVYGSANALDSFNPDDFFRQDYIPVIMWKNNVVAMHLYTFFNFNQKSATDHHYFEFFNQTYLASLRSKEINHAMSMEYLTVDPNWRRKNIGIAMGEVLVGTGLKLMNTTFAQAAIAPARKDVPAADFAYTFNFTCIEPSVICRNFECDLVAGFRDLTREHPEDHMQQLIQNLWDNRIDTTISNIKAKEITNEFKSII
jgi:hypothetical protein